jgi:hypothetical protein
MSGPILKRYFFSALLRSAEEATEPPTESERLERKSTGKINGIKKKKEKGSSCRIVFKRKHSREMD